MEYLIEALVNKMRNNANLSGEVGTDDNSNAKIYHARAPQSLIDASDFPYVVFHILPGGTVYRTFDAGRVGDEWPIQVDVFSDTDQREAAEIMQYVVAALDEQSLDGLAYTESSSSPEPGARTTLRVMLSEPPRIMQDDDDIWHASADFTVGLRVA